MRSHDTQYASVGTSCGLMSVSVCLSVTSQFSIKRDEQINLLFVMEASIDHSHTAI